MWQKTHKYLDFILLFVLTEWDITSVLFCCQSRNCSILFHPFISQSRLVWPHCKIQKFMLNGNKSYLSLRIYSWNYWYLLGSPTERSGLQRLVTYPWSREPRLRRNSGTSDRQRSEDKRPRRRQLWGNHPATWRSQQRQDRCRSAVS